jgi:PIN domain nuclease of toxin-antitoxin system
MLLLDTHTAVWALLGNSRLSPSAREAIEAKEVAVAVSIVSVWEIAIKVGLSKWPEAVPLLAGIEDHLERVQFRLLPITVPHVRAAGLMQSPHRDPFDRLLAAQAMIEGLTIVTADPKVQTLGAPWLW